MSRDMWHTHKRKFEEKSKANEGDFFLKKKSEKFINSLKPSLKNSGILFEGICLQNIEYTMIHWYKRLSKGCKNPIFMNEHIE